MNLRYLVDTDWVIHWLNGNEEIRRRLDQVKEEGWEYPLYPWLSCTRVSTTAGTKKPLKKG